MQEFTEKILANGIKLYHYAANFPVSSFEIMLPIGSAHAGVKGGIIPGGAPHFLEHMQMLRSINYPEKGLLDKKIGLEGGYNNAYTMPFWTAYGMTAPSDSVEATLPGLVERVFSPIFEKEDFENQRQIITNEREHRRKFFPGNSQSSQYFGLQFMNDVSIELDRVFGSPEALATFDPELMYKVHHQAAATEGVVAFSAGAHDPLLFEDVLTAIAPSRRVEAPSQFDQTTWVHKEYHEKSFENITQPSLTVAWIMPGLTYEEKTGLNFLLNYFCNSVHGPLYEILRHDKGWVYDLDWYHVNLPQQQMYGMNFPVMDTKVIQEIRSSLFGWFREALHDQVRVEKEIHRRIRHQVTWYETAEGTVEDEADGYRTHGRWIRHEEWERAIRHMADPEHRRFIFESYLARQDWFGEMAFLPED